MGGQWRQCHHLLFCLPTRCLLHTWGHIAYEVRLTAGRALMVGVVLKGICVLHQYRVLLCDHMLSFLALAPPHFFDWPPPSLVVVSSSCVTFDSIANQVWVTSSRIAAHGEGDSATFRGFAGKMFRSLPIDDMCRRASVARPPSHLDLPGLFCRLHGHNPAVGWDSLFLGRRLLFLVATALNVRDVCRSRSCLASVG